MKTITDAKDIRRILDDVMLGAEQGFIPAIYLRKGANYNGRTLNGTLVVEGARPMGAATDSEGRRYSLTNSDSGYSRSIGIVNLADIEQIEIP